MSYDILIKGGQIVDGTGNPWFHADIGIIDGKIVSIGRLSGNSNRVIDADGLVVAPGFIDIHSHADMQFGSPRHPEFLDCFIHQGITTVITGNCGFSPAPLPPKLSDEYKDYVMFLSPNDVAWEWDSFSDWLGYLERLGVLLNVAPLVGHLPIRVYAMGFERRNPTADELQHMQQLLKEALQYGAFGLSVGLVYAPSFYSDTSELTALADVVSEAGAIYAGHFRGYSETLLMAIRETLEIAESTGVRIQFSHLHAMGKDYWPEIPKALELINNSRSKGIDIAYDAIPIYIGTTGLSRMFPYKYLEGGVENLIAKLKDPVSREQIRREVEEPDLKSGEGISPDWWENFVELLGYNNLKLMIPAIEEDKSIVGVPFSELARRQGVSPFQAMVDLTIRERGEGCVELVGVSGDKPDSKALLDCLSDRNGVISTDAVITGKGPGNPTSYGAFARVIGYYARDLSLFSLEEAVRKITSFPAKRAGVHDRGLVQKGLAADLTLFDYTKIRDISKPSDPAHFPEGIEYVLINGHVVKEGTHVERKNLFGNVLRATRDF
jgi:N-acyl-D-aspartate/D-glutamate deacylase